MDLFGFWGEESDGSSSDLFDRISIYMNDFGVGYIGRINFYVINFIRFLWFIQWHQAAGAFFNLFVIYFCVNFRLSSHVQVFKDSIWLHLWIWKSDVSMWIPSSCDFLKVNDLLLKIKSTTQISFLENKYKELRNFIVFVIGNKRRAHLLPPR